MAAGSLPEPLLARFRTLSLERIGRVESAWQALFQGVEGEEAASRLLRDLHSVKGDARVTNFLDVHLLCQKLEDLVAAAAQRDYQVAEDFDLVVTMAIQFVGVLLRHTGSGSMGGLDLEGFVRQVDEVLQEARATPVPRRGPRGRRDSKASEAAVDRLSEPTQHRLGAAAAATFLEHVAAAPPARDRLRQVWEMLRDELSRLQSVELAPLIRRHVAGAERLAEELGKRVAIELEVSELRAAPRVAEALDLAAVHLMSNAIDHGIEAPERRCGVRKAEVATLRVRGRLGDAVLELTVEDDGAGIDLDAVRSRAIERGLLAEARAREAAEPELLDLLFHPGFSTRAEVSEISGRGVGLDAVKSAIVRLGGTVEVSSSPGRGTSMTMKVPHRRRQIRVYRFLAPGGEVPIAVASGWAPKVLRPPGSGVIDPIASAGGASCPPPDRAVRLTWGFLEVVVGASGDPVLATGERICPTADDHPVEVICIDDEETLLLRPEHL